MGCGRVVEGESSSLHLRTGHRPRRDETSVVRLLGGSLVCMLLEAEGIGSP